MKAEGLSDQEVNFQKQNFIVKILLYFFLKKLEKRHLHAAKETEYLRLKRVKMSADDFEPLKVIGRGAFGEVTVSFKKNIFFSKLINFL